MSCPTLRRFFLVLKTTEPGRFWEIRRVLDRNTSAGIGEPAHVIYQSTIVAAIPPSVYIQVMELTDRIAKKLCDARGLGCDIRTCAGKARIKLSVLNEWLRLGAESEDDDDIYSKFHIDFEAARADAVEHLIKLSLMHAKKSGSSCNWHTERVVTDNWDGTKKLNVSTKDEKLTYTIPDELVY